jgi:hypothetical protein
LRIRRDRRRHDHQRRAFVTTSVKRTFVTVSALEGRIPDPEGVFISMSPDGDLGVTRLVVNGGEDAAGVGLDDPARESWPAVLAEALGADLVNLAEPWSSNRRILRTTVSALPSLEGKTPAARSETLVIPMWAAIDRYEVVAGRRRRPWTTSLLDRWLERGGHLLEAGHRLFVEEHLLPWLVRNRIVDLPATSQHSGASAGSRSASTTHVRHSSVTRRPG